MNSPALTAAILAANNALDNLAAAKIAADGRNASPAALAALAAAAIEANAALSLYNKIRAASR